MTEADLYPHLAHLAGGQVYPYVVPLLDGRPSVALPWVVFQPDFIGVGGRDGRAGGVLSVGADRRLCRDCDAGASDTSGRP
ncbi:putative structural component of prophage [Escherichia coli]|nr:putative structural component of prophage [Escherichia coli]